MKILMLTDSNRREAGGAEQYFNNLMNLLETKGHDVYTFEFGDAYIKSKKGIQYKESGNVIGRLMWRLFFNYPVYHKLKSFIKKINPDVIHLHNVNKYIFSILLACKNRKVVMTVHDYGLISPGFIYIYKLQKPKPVNFLQKIQFLYLYYLRNPLLKKVCSAFIAPSKPLKSALEKHSFRHVYCVPHFINKKDWKFTNIKNGNSVLYVGGLARHKGIYIALAAFKKVLEKVPDAHLTLAGPVLEKKVYGFVRKNNMQSAVTIKGAVGKAELKKYYSLSKVTLIPSLIIEQFGLVGLESLASGTPCIGSNIGGIPDWLTHGKNGYLVKPGDADAIAKHVVRILTDENLRKRLAQNGLDTIKKFNKEDHYKKLMEVYAR